MLNLFLQSCKCLCGIFLQDEKETEEVGEKEVEEITDEE